MQQPHLQLQWASGCASRAPAHPGRGSADPRAPSPDTEGTFSLVSLSLGGQSLALWTSLLQADGVKPTIELSPALPCYRHMHADHCSDLSGSIFLLA